MILAQAKANVQAMEPRVWMLMECIREMEDAAHSGTRLMAEGNTIEAVLMLVQAISRAQLIQLNSALKEGEDNLDQSRRVITQIESKVKIFRPSGFTPNSGA